MMMIPGAAGNGRAGGRLHDALRPWQMGWLAPFPRGWLLKSGFDFNRGMIRTVEAIVDEKGQVRLSEPLRLSRSQRALVTILDEEPLPQLHEDSLLSERALEEDWNRPEEDAAWSHLGEVR